MKVLLTRLIIIWKRIIQEVTSLKDWLLKETGSTLYTGAHKLVKLW